MNPNRHVNAPASGEGNNLVTAISGLYYAPVFLTTEEQTECVQRVDAAVNEWRNDISRRTQHYGWRYDYRARAITPDMYLGQLPGWLEELAQKLHRELVRADGAPMWAHVPEQVIVNEYVGAQGIRPHIDHPGFGPVICTISLLEDWEMDLSIRRNQNQSALLETGSCLTMTGESRSRWYHGIQARREEPGGQRRGRRLSLTFRTILNRDSIND